MTECMIAQLRAENASLKADIATLAVAYDAMRDDRLVEMKNRLKEEVMAMLGVRPSRENDDCACCAAAEPTDLDRLFDTVNACLYGWQLDPYENFGAMTVGEGKLDLRKLLALLMGEELFTRPDGRTERTPNLPRR